MQVQQIVGRTKELAILQNALTSKKSEFVVVHGRRRVGKTFLIKHTLNGQIDFEMTGTQGGDQSDQLNLFKARLAQHSNAKCKKPKTWMDAFFMLRTYLDTIPQDKKRVIFLDELPWIDTHKSKFLGMLGHFWNDWAAYNNVLLVVCGSAASWMIKNVLNNKGGLHNRATQYISMQPFTLAETEQFLQLKNITAPRYQVTQLYMALGGVPYYIDLLDPSQSIPQNIDRLCFDANGFLRSEFDRLYASLFDSADNHIAVVKALASKWKGLNRNEITALTKIGNSGNLTRVLEELERSAFIQSYPPFEKSKKGTLYRLTDNYSLFYLKVIAKRGLLNQENVFLKILNSPDFHVWSGYAFENTCFVHHRQIAKALGVSAIFHEFSSFQYVADTENDGIQVDMLIDRADGVINLCEIKYSNAEYRLTPAYKATLRERSGSFAAITKVRKAIFTTLITTYGLTNQSEHTDVVQNVVTLEQLFQA